MRGRGTSNGLTSNLGRGGGVKPKLKNLLDQLDEKKQHELMRTNSENKQTG